MHRWHLLWLGLLSPALAAQAKRAIQPSDVAQLRDLADFRISPDGRRAVFVVREPEDTATPGERNTDLWLVPTDGTAEPRRLTASPKTDESPRWSPDGHAVALVGADRPALDRVYWHSAAYTLDLKTNETTRLADGTGPIRFAPAGDAVAFSVRYTGLRSTGLPAVLRHGGAPKTLAVTAHGTVTGGGEWLADGRHLLVVETVGASHRLATLDVDADTFTDR